MSDYSHVLTVKFKANGDAEVELKSPASGPMLEKPVLIEAADKKRSKVTAWCEAAGSALGAFARSLWPF